jgi:cation-transporting P-type ATPase C
MASLDTIAFDKTGTLTESIPTVTQVIPCAPGYTEERILHLAARAEIHCQHPLAVTIVQRAGLLRSDIDEDTEVELLAGRGVKASWHENEVAVGSRRLLDECQVPVSIEHEQLFASRLHEQESLVYVAHQRRLIGLLAISVKIRPEAVTSLERLREAGIKDLVMLTGDLENVTAHVAGQVGITQWRSRLLPQDKFDEIQRLRASGRKVAVVGDGINDAPALAVADVGFAMGTAGSDVAIETADVALASDDLRHVADVVHISRKTMSVIRQNYSMALGVNSIGLYLAAAGSINPIIAAVLHNLSTILVVFNSSRLINYDPEGARLRVDRSLLMPATQEVEGKHGCCGGSSKTTATKKRHLHKETTELCCY